MGRKRHEEQLPPGQGLKSVLSLKELTSVFGVSRQMVWRWYKSGKLKSYCVEDVIRLVRQFERERILKEVTEKVHHIVADTLRVPEEVAKDTQPETE